MAMLYCKPHGSLFFLSFRNAAGAVDGCGLCGVPGGVAWRNGASTSARAAGALPVPGVCGGEDGRDPLNGGVLPPTGPKLARIYARS